ncbi:hypothetical protein MGYG_05239 [Nannizzia gypsea CBS 118893]|uniref:Uncharacterized protein n=1 Tax=Arthroderma gypseum (strain ATCC MYA-4604 / CBS 118893) TaxID=535722 RepID=E4UVB0_ARTGP|nr:hypothetical protein MGYG_05239 [Nannizzia gypsea CBS 118893]EFR02237.1 hypothetical protein MGYG_05239 [Nannizzia gypsea CBS 118893]
MDSPTKLNTEILDTLVDGKDRTSAKLKAIIKRPAPIIDTSSIHLSDGQLRDYSISKSTMSLEQGGHFFKPLSQQCSESLARHEEFYEDALKIYWKPGNLLVSETPVTPKDKLNVGRCFADYAAWRTAHVNRSLYGGHYGMPGPGRESTDWRFELTLEQHIRGTYSKPHIISLSRHGLYLDENNNSKIACNGILVAADTMRYRIDLPVYIPSDIYPARMNEVYFENDALHFNYIDLNYLERSNLDLYAHWALSNTISETTRYPIKPSAGIIINYLNERGRGKKRANSL